MTDPTLKSVIKDDSAAGIVGETESLDPSKIGLTIKALSLNYGNKKILKDINIDVRKNKVTALIGPSGSGKSSILRTVNRMTDFSDTVELAGEVFFDGINVLDPKIDLLTLRRRIGLVFQRPTAFPMSIFDNVAFGPRLHGITNKEKLKEIVHGSLKQAALWEEVKNILGDNGLNLSGGQQQRLCIARALAVEPEILLMDEPCSALDPIATQKIEDLIIKLKKTVTVLIVTHNMQQAARISDFTAFLFSPEENEPATIIEYDQTKKIFTKPNSKKTEDYISGRFG